MAAEREIVVEVPEGSAGFKCDEQLVITRIDAGGRCEAAGVQMGWVVTAFQDERFAPSFTWTQLKGLAKTTPKPWNFAFGPHASGAVAQGGGGGGQAAAGQREETPVSAAAPSGAPQLSLNPAATAAETPPPTAISAESRAQVRAMFRAAKENDVEKLRAAIAAGADVNQCTQDGWSALLMASWAGHQECAMILRKAGASIDSAALPTTEASPYLEARRMVYEERRDGKALPKGVSRLVEVPMRTDMDHKDSSYRESFAVNR
jgi:hypothetical protein